MVSLMPGKSEHERQVEGRAVITAFIFKQHLFSIDELSVVEAYGIASWYFLCA